VKKSSLYQNLPDLLLVLVPRHPERSAQVAELCQRRGFTVVARSERRGCSADTQVFLGNTLGEMLLFYAAADVAFVGGSLVPVGGHNVLEPTLLGLPVLFGLHMFNFSDASQKLLQAQAAWQVADSHELATIATKLLTDPVLREAAGKRGQTVLQANRGALAKLLEIIEEMLKQRGLSVDRSP
jgi:3-deoxy-D-manno-octulosonic-acid transferase